MDKEEYYARLLDVLESIEKSLRIIASNTKTFDPVLVDPITGKKKTSS